jgi:hypothetical protein
VVQGSSAPQVFIPKMIKLWRAGCFPLDKLVKKYTLDEIDPGLDGSTSRSLDVQSGQPDSTQPNSSECHRCLGAELSRMS